ncbi:ABC transporter permease [Luteibacter aegosomaticola]|uniref:ABC transporter permease n=1 Tax=Luteibacter aegosomaticola TaxID=2911538 RepID=UPI001FFB58D3|nr:ABC transporter permease [Luteibacter aegosomaticola]UPG89740.1 ABC transporter permease [Luteibacter aegosomaticola]
MFAYYLALAIRSFRRNIGMTVLMVLTVAFGVAASMTTYAVFRAVSGDPIPWKSGSLFVPQLDTWGPDQRGARTEPPVALDYRTATDLLRDARGDAQAAMYKISPAVSSATAGTHPANVDGHAVSSDFFGMFDVPFQDGAGWSREDDARHANVAVISARLAGKLFRGESAIGREIGMDGRSYRVVGVTRPWNPQPRFYDVVNTGGFSTASEDIFVPFATAIDAGIMNTGNTDCVKSPEDSGIRGLVGSNCAWLSYMVLLTDHAREDAYRQYLQGYAAQLQASGAIAWQPAVRLQDLPHWLDARHVVPPDTGVSLLVAMGLLLVCLVNTAGLLLAKFQRRGAEIGVRRAIGASRKDIYAQFLIESGMVGAAGGIAGLLLTFAGVACVHALLPPEIASLARFDGSLLLATIVLAIVSTVAAGAYPTFRATLVQPTLQLKST